MLVLNKYKWDKYSYCINKQYILFIPNIILNIKWEIIKTFNLSDPIEKQLSRINGFYNVLSKIDVWRDKITVIKLEDNIKKDPANAINWDSDAYQDQGSFHIRYDYEERCKWVKWCENGCIKVWYSEYQYWEHIQWLERGDEDDRYECYKKEEFYLLMQIYYWLYDDEKLKRELEEKEKRWEYDKYKEILKKEDMYEIAQEAIKLNEEEKKKRNEYLDLEILRKSTKWAFPELNIKKIYDKNWDEEEQKKVIEKVNKELGEEVVILK